MHKFRLRACAFAVLAVLTVACGEDPSDPEVDPAGDTVATAPATTSSGGLYDGDD